MRKNKLNHTQMVAIFEKVCLDKVGKELSFVFPYTNDDLRYSKGEACTLFRKMVGDYVKRAQQKLENCRDLQKKKKLYTHILSYHGDDLPEDEVANMQEYQSKHAVVDKEIQEMLDKWNDRELRNKHDQLVAKPGPFGVLLVSASAMRLELKHRVMQSFEELVRELEKLKNDLSILETDEVFYLLQVLDQCARNKLNHTQMVAIFEKVCLDKVGKELSFVFPYTNDDLRYSKGEACTLFRQMVGDYVKRAQQKLENCRDLQKKKKLYSRLLTVYRGVELPEDEVANMQEYENKHAVVDKEIQEMLAKWNDREYI
uniref:Uncharacterized protein n=1 Tax=Ditylenchus dipsaci TaxID=166011 RepID=A0A915EIE4_9BILA